MTETVLWIFFIFSAVVLHEVAHGLAAYFLGDPTAKSAGRLSLNPLKHIDLFWTVLLPAALYFSTQGKLVFGMAKPVPVNFNRLRHPRRDTILVALAGPVTNLLLAALLSFVWGHYGSTFALYGAYLNLGLGVFNLIPVPPMDGSRVFSVLLPERAGAAFLSMDRWGFLIVIFMHMTGILFKILVPMINFFCNLLHIPPFNLDAQGF